MEIWQERTFMLLGDKGMERLTGSSVMIVGVGGVGGYAAEMLARSGVGHITIVDSDTVGESNINRQILALHTTVGMPKVEVLRERLRDINPSIDLRTVPEYINEENVGNLFLDGNGEEIRYDVVVDAIDTLSPKISLIQYCLKHDIPLVSSMGSGAKMDATAVRIADISKTCQCPLAHMLRKRLHKLGIHNGFQAVFSTEAPHRESLSLEESRNKKSQVGTISYMPAVFGCVCAQAAISRIIGQD